MKPMVIAAVAALSLTACRSDETVAAYGASGAVWYLESIDGKAFSDVATIEFADGGRVSGQGACNRWFGLQTKPYPWFGVDAIGASKMACPNLAAETAYFDALREMSLSEVSGGVLVLSNDAGREMVFVNRP